MNAKVTFRTFGPEDHSDIEEMIQGLYTDDPSTEGMSVEKIRRTLSELTRYPEKGTIILFDVDHAIAGYSILVHFWSNEYGGTIEVIDELYIRPEWRGKGLASAFLKHLTETTDDSVKGLALEVTPRNDRARALYTRHGFRTAKNEHLFRKRETPA